MTTLAERLASNAATRAYYAAQSNTQKMVMHVIEWRLPEDQNWTPAIGVGTYSLGYVDDALPMHNDNAYCYTSGKEAAQWLKDNKEYIKPQWFNALSYEDRRTFNNSKLSFRIGRYQLPQWLADEIEQDAAWKAREASRFEDGTYTKLPWADAPWFKEEHERRNHFAHVSTTDQGMIAYTPTDSYGREGRKTRISPGKYLTQYFYSNLYCEPRQETGALNVHGNKVTCDALSWYARNFSLTYGTAETLKFATTPDEIVSVYINGPDSCMSKGMDDFNCDGHPCRIYGAGDLALAYTQETGGRITARALVWPDKKLVGRIYGDDMTLQMLLEEQGYAKSNWDALVGAKMLKIRARNNTYVMPYIDSHDNGCFHVSDCGEYLIIGEGDDEMFDASNTNGLSGEQRSRGYDYICDHCNEGTDDPVPVYVLNRRHREVEHLWCEGCADGNTYICESNHQTYADSVPAITTAGGDTIATHNTVDDYFQCSVDGEYYHNDESAGSYEDEGTVAGCNTDALVEDFSTGIWWRAENLPATAENEDGELYSQPTLDLFSDDAEDTNETLAA
jgi:hypothetical protein